MPDILQRLGLSMNVAIVIVAVAAVIVVGLFLLLRSKPNVKVRPSGLAIDLGTLPQMGPVPVGPKLTVHNVPMRLAVVVLAPAGRGAPPPEHDIPTILDEVVPGLKDVIAAHQPVCRGWPGQLSSEGFANTFFTNVRLPGDKGKGTPWCEVAGRATSSGQKYLVGLALRAATPNPFGQTLVERESQWLDLLRVGR